MPGKKAHKPRDVEKAGTHSIHGEAGSGRKNFGQTAGQYARAGKGRRGQFSGAGNPGLIKK